MFAYPKQAEFNRVVPKTKIFAHSRPGTRLKELFSSQVDQIVWKYKLAPETLNLPAKGGITEIQVFEITLKTGELNEDVLSTIDKAIPFPLLFQIVHDDRIHFAASFKRPSEADSTKWVIEALFRGRWLPRSSLILHPLPVCLDLAALYEQLIRQHLPLKARPGENLRDQVTRYRMIQMKEKEAQQLERRLGREKQFNRKVELNAALRRAREELQDLQTLS